MKQQIARFSPHQNAKVAAVLMAVTSLLFIVPFVLVFSFVLPAQGRPPLLMFLIMPVMYLVIGYIAVALSCLIYNLLARYTGGIEFESEATAS